MRKLLATFSSINSSRVARVALWLVGEYCTEASDVALAFSTIKSCVGDLPFVPDEGVCASGVGNVLKEEDTALSRGGGRPLVLADGSYASQSAVESEAAAVAATTAGSGAVDDTRNLRGILATGIPTGPPNCTACTRTTHTSITHTIMQHGRRLLPRHCRCLIAGQTSTAFPSAVATESCQHGGCRCHAPNDRAASTWKCEGRAWARCGFA